MKGEQRVGRQRPLSFEDWSDGVPGVVKSQALWSLIVYQKSLFLHDLCWFDCEAWLADARGHALAGQIIRSCGSISANLEEGYGRGFGRDYVRFLTIAVASARETAGWYLRARYLMNPEALDHRLALCDEIIAMLVTTIGTQKQLLSTKSRA